MHVEGGPFGVGAVRVGDRVAKELRIRHLQRCCMLGLFKPIMLTLLMILIWFAQNIGRRNADADARNQCDYFDIRDVKKTLIIATCDYGFS